MLYHLLFVYCVGNNPDVEQRILNEIKRVFGHGSDFNITYEDLNKLEYIEAVIKEGKYSLNFFNRINQILFNPFDISFPSVKNLACYGNYFTPRYRSN
jgi:hypothetical protein